MDSVAITVGDNHRNGEIDKINEEECLNEREIIVSVTGKPESEGDKSGCYNESFSKSESAVSIEINSECNDNVDDTEQPDEKVFNHQTNTMESTNSVDNDDDITKTKLWQGASLANYWPANDINSLIRQTIIRCNDTFNGNHAIHTETLDFIDYNNVMIMCSKLSGNKEVIL